MKREFIPFGVILILLLGSSCATTPSTTAENRFNAPALTNWHKESGIRVPDAVSTSIIRLSNGQYRIFYPGGEGIISSVSSDGYTFTKEAGVRIDYSASYDQLADVQSAVKISSNNYKMYFVYDWYGDNSIKGAASADGLSWEVKTLSGFLDSCMDPEVMLDGSGNLIMFFAAPRTTAKGGPMDIYKATSTDGIDWSVVGQAISPEKSEEGQVVGDPDIIRLPDGTYRMYYYGMLQSKSDILSATAESL